MRMTFYTVPDGRSSSSLFDAARKQQEAEELARRAYWNRLPRPVGNKDGRSGFRPPRQLPKQDMTGRQTHIYGRLTINPDPAGPRSYADGARSRRWAVIDGETDTTLWSDGTCYTHEEAIALLVEAVNWYRRDAESKWGAEVIG